MTTNELNIDACCKAFEAGMAWVAALKVGDLFHGAMPEARKRFDDSRFESMFTSGALLALETVEVWTGCDAKGDSGIIVQLVRK